MFSLIVVAAATGVLSTAVIRRTTDAVRLKRARKRIAAHLLEFRLFFDEPVLVWRAQVELLLENVRFIRLLLPAMLLVAVPLWWVILQLEFIYGLRPVRPGESALVTAQLTRPIQQTDRFELRGTVDVSIETPPVRVQHDNQVSWRVRGVRDSREELKLAINGYWFEKAFVTGPAPKVLSPRRWHSIMTSILYPEESRLPGEDLNWVEVSYPDAGSGWLIWFTAISTCAAVASMKFIPAATQRDSGKLKVR